MGNRQPRERLKNGVFDITTLQVELAPKLIPVLTPPLGTYRYRVLRGGRGSGKSFSVAKMAAIWGAVQPLRILCVREFQNTIKESFHAELKSAINSCQWLSTQYDVGVDYLRHKTNSTEFIFKGLRHNIDGVKSMAQIDLVICEESETIPHTSWRDLLPTIRAPKSEIIIIYNPKRRDSWVAQTFDTDKLPPRTIVVDVNYTDSPWFPAVLDEQRLHDRETLDPALYRHIWEGAYYEQSDAQVFAGRYQIADFEPAANWDGPYYGVDFGFSADPTAGVKCWIHDGNLYIEHELYQQRLELDDTGPELIEALPDIERHACRADNARPESISYLKRHGLPRMVACEKGKGSVEDGIEFIKSFKKVVIHSRCPNTAKEFDLYNYKTDRLSGDILPVLLDANNHAIDALRYALEAIMKRNKRTAGVAL